jgi:hypothetical protein
MTEKQCHCACRHLTMTHLVASLEVWLRPSISCWQIPGLITHPMLLHALLWWYWLLVQVV